MMDGCKLINSNWKTEYFFFKGGVSWHLKMMHDMADPPPTMEELTNVDLKLIKIINRDYNWNAPPYICKETTHTLLL